MRQFLPGIALVGCVMAGAAPALAQQPSCDDWGSRAFFESAAFATVADCLDAGADVHARNDTGDTPLHVAALWNGNPAVITVLLEAGADVHARNEDEETPLHEAARSNPNPAVSAVLVDAGADVHAGNENEETPLHRAAQSNPNPAVIAVLVDAGADVHARDNIGATPLHNVAKYSDSPSVVTVLVDAGSDVHARDNVEDTPLHDAAKSNPNPAVITALLAAGANLLALDYSGDTPLHKAVERSDSAAFVAAFSVEAIAAFKEQQREDEAAAREQEVERQLREARVACEKWNTPAFFRHADVEDVTRCLADNDPNAVDDQGRTPMHLAALDGTPEVMAPWPKREPIPMRWTTRADPPCTSWPTSAPTPRP